MTGMPHRAKRSEAVSPTGPLPMTTTGAPVYLVRWFIVFSSALALGRGFWRRFSVRV
jgi:hypothetical protein